MYVYILYMSDCCIRLNKTRQKHLNYTTKLKKLQKTYKYLKKPQQNLPKL